MIRFKSHRQVGVTLIAFAVGGLAPHFASAQGLQEALLEEIVVTATKKAGGTFVQDTPVAITALGEDQIDALFLRDLKAVGFAAPNVQLEDIGTTRGSANFSIRGLGINSSIATIDPTVGVFVDGMYLGINSGVVLDMFDLEGIEVLRGPQGLLFGRNVTGGAVLLRTTRPGDEVSVNTRLAVETGSNVYASAVVSGPFNEAGSIGGKFAVYHNSDGGYFTNQANNNDEFGEADTTLIRGALSFEPNDFFDVIIRYEHGDSDGDGPAAQNGGLFNPESFDFAVDDEGFYDSDWDQVVIEANLTVGFGEGLITNILGWRDYSTVTRGDIDATPQFLFHAPALLDQDQLSNELRYNGTFGNAELTTGLFYFTQDISVVERRLILGGAVDITGGGVQDGYTWGAFTSLDYAINDSFVLNLGVRYSFEEKEAQVASIPLNLCNIDDGRCNAFDFTDKEDWNAVTPKVGFQWTPDDVTQVYGFWTRGFRSGGYNFRDTSVVLEPGPFDQEEQDSFELGLKRDFYGNKLRVNAAIFYNEISDLQREINQADPFVGVVQIIRNTADATITGFDLEAQWFATDNFVIQANAGYVDGEYDEVRFDISGDGVVDAADLRLDLPRLAPWSYGLRTIFNHDFGGSRFTAQASFSRRDPAAYTDSNLGRLRAADMLDASLGIDFLEGTLRFSLFGKNLKDESTIGGDTQLPFFPGATFSPLNKGRIYGGEIQYKY